MTFMPVLADASGKYADPLGRAVAIEWIEDPGIAAQTGPQWASPGA